MPTNRRLLYLNETEQILLAQKDPQIREKLLIENDEYIRRCASKAAKRFVDSHDDAYSEALIAFNDAVNAYSPSRGSFYGLASVEIQNRVTDLLRKENHNSNAVPFSSIVSEDEDGNEKSFEKADNAPVMSDTVLEIEILKHELDNFGISFFDLPKATPKFGRTKRICKEVIAWLIKQPELIRGIKEKKCLSAKQITDTLHTSSKILERKRNYIIASVLICTGDYPIIQEYFNLGKEVR